MPKAKDPHVVLGVPRGAGISQVKKAYRRLVLALHPDRSDDRSCTEQLREVQRAYETLNEPARREPGPETSTAAHDADKHVIPIRRRPTRPFEPGPRGPVPEPLTYSSWRHGVRFQPEPFATSTAEHVAKRMRSAFTRVDEELGGRVPEMFGNRPSSVPKDLFVEIVLTEQEARLGGTFPLTVPLQKPCRACLGSGLGGLTRHCTYCEGRGFRMAHKDLEIVVPANVHDGQETEMRISSGDQPVVLRVLVRVA